MPYFTNSLAVTADLSSERTRIYRFAPTHVRHLASFHSFPLVLSRLINKRNAREPRAVERSRYRQDNGRCERATRHGTARRRKTRLYYSHYVIGQTRRARANSRAVRRVNCYTPENGATKRLSVPSRFGLICIHRD